MEGATIFRPGAPRPRRAREDRWPRLNHLGATREPRIETVHTDPNPMMASGSMKAILATGYGSPDVLRLQEVPKPEPKDDEVLIRIRATTVSAADWRVRSLDVPTGFGIMVRLAFGISRPRQPILGTDLAGEVVAVGRRVERFHEGDAVIASPGAAMGCHAEYRTMPESGAITRKPESLTFEEAASLPFGGGTALAFLRRAGLRRGERVLVNGASGAVGSAAVQLARHFGAEVTGVCSTANLELVQSLGADRVIDYTREDFTASGIAYDIVVDTVGALTFADMKASLGSRGRLVLVSADLPAMLRTPWVAMTSRRRIVVGPLETTAEDLRLLAELAAAGELRPVIDRCYPLEQSIDAHRYVDTRRKRGSVVLTVG